MNKIAGRLLISCILLVAVTGCGEAKKQQNVPELLEPVGNIADTAVVTKGDISNTKIYDAQVIPYTEELGFTIDGTVADVKVKLGDIVSKGDIIAVLDGAGDGNEYDSSVNELEQNMRSYEEENLVAEYDIKILETEKKQLKGRYNKASGPEKDELKKQIRIKEADINIAKQSLKGKKELQKIEIKELRRKKDAAAKKVQEYYLYASMDGVVTYVDIEPGGEVTANTFVVAVSDMNTKQIKSEFVSKRDLKAADDYYVLYKDRHYGVVQHEYDPNEIDALIKEEKKAYAYYDLKEKNVDFEVGDSLELYVISAECKNVLLIPVNALYNENGEYYVYVKSGESKVRQNVTIGTITTSMVRIVDGLEEGDVVYVKE